jgi:hypothetical protein
METVEKKKRIVNRSPKKQEPLTRESLIAKKREIEKRIRLLQLELQAVDIELEFLPENAENETLT